MFFAFFCEKGRGSSERKESPQTSPEEQTVPLWVIPMIYIVASFAAGLILPRLEFEFLPAYTHSMSPASAQAYLSSVSAGMMALTAIVFSITFLLVQYTATAYSKRLILLLGRDPILFHALGVFVATFIYALGTLAYVDRAQSGKVPFLSMILVGVLLAASMILLALLTHRLNSLRVTRVLGMIGDEGRRLIRLSFLSQPGRATPETAAQKASRSAILAAAPSQTLRYSGDPQTIARLDIPALVGIAQGAGAVIAVERAVGDTVADGVAMIKVYGTATTIPAKSLCSAVYMSAEHVFERDMKYLIRLLVDTAIMALSPGVNDPTTAVQTIDQIEDLISRLGRCELDGGVAEDADGKIRVLYPVSSWEDYLSLAFDEIRLYGEGSLQVMRRLRSALVDLLDSLQDANRIEAVRRYLSHLNESVARSSFDAIDRGVASGSDPQGLGLTRLRSEQL